MSVCAVMLVKDEADIIERTVRYLCRQVDAVVVADNGSADGTLEVLLHLATLGLPLTVGRDEEPAYYQERKTSSLAAGAFDAGHQWVLPCDADEFWYAPDGRTLSQYLGGVGRDVQFVTADLYNHLPTSKDPESCDPVERIGWRQRQRAPLPKVCCRARDGLRIHQGNHSAWAPGVGLKVPGLVIRHFSWRSAEQYVRKIRNGEAAYAATNLPVEVGAHWRMFEGAPDEAVVEHFYRWFHCTDPGADDSLIYDPAPV